MDRLRDLGERRIVRELLPEFVPDVGSDCAIVEVPAGQLVATTDPVPEPAARLLGGDPDPYWMGWLLVVINASDLAASGAKPLAFLAAVEAPVDLPTSDFRRFLLGIAECCKAEGLRYAGGNLREGPRLSAVGTALGTCRPGRALKRWGASHGDILTSIGIGGRFWHDVLVLRSGGTVDKDRSPLFRPYSQMPSMRLLAESGCVTAAMDNSDGLLPTLQQMSSSNGLRLILHLDWLTPLEYSDLTSIDPARLWLGWGDWNVIAAIPEPHVSTARDEVAAFGGSLTPIGRFVEGEPGVILMRGANLSPAPRLESERFAADSWFSAGIEAYLEQLRTVPLP